MHDPDPIITALAALALIVAGVWLIFRGDDK